ncbi:hypothetical protein HZA75_07860 [Candidatus Roizmanbacteria bacterium]|nr:hypothetical protein [Candidatus Roizmanbacteria bacterium]
MKKNRINLLVSREDYQKYENYFEQLKLSAAVLTAILFILFISFYLVLRNKFNLYENMNLQKKTHLQLLSERRGDEAKINYIEKKYLDLKTFLKDDASTTPYYQLLSSAIKDSSKSAGLKSFEVNKDRMTSFTISFSAFKELMDFLKFAESQTFIKNFENISLKNFVVLGKKEKKESYELSFSGKFIPFKLDLNNEK